MKYLINPQVHGHFASWHLQTLRFALVQYGGGITAMSGSIAGTVFSRNRFGNYTRPRTKPVNPHSARQESIRTIMSYLAEYWHDQLTAVQRGLWNTYAAAVAMKNRIGQTVHLTGFNHFVRSNAAAMSAGAPVIDAAPTILSLPEKDTVLQCTEENIAGQTFTFTCDTSGWAPNGDPKVWILLYQGQPKLASRHFFAGPWRFMGIIDATEGAAGSSTETAAFAFALGQQVWFQARVLTVSYRLSGLWSLDPRVITADP